MPSDRTLERIVAYAMRLEGMDRDILRDGLKIATMHRKIEEAIEQLMAGWGLTCRQVEILEVLYHNQDATFTPAGLAEELGMSRSAMTGALDGLERLGYAVRAAHPTDRRMLTIHLTDTARQFMERILPQRYRKIHQVMGLLSGQARGLLLHYYRTVLAFLEAEMKEKTR